MSSHALERFVLCIDDDHDFLESLESFLPGLAASWNASVRHRFVFLDDPVRALSDLEDLVLGGQIVAMTMTVDEMPSMKGLELLLEVRRRDPDCLRVLLTGHSGAGSAIEAVDTKLIDGYLTKPIHDENEFAQGVRHLLQNHELHRTIGRQNEIIRNLHDFATALHACDSVAATLERIASFAADSLANAWVCVALAENGRIASSAIHGLAPLDPARFGAYPEHESSAIATCSLTSADRVPGIGAALAAADGASQRPWFHLPIVADGASIGLVGCALPKGSPAEVEAAVATLGYIANTSSMAFLNQLNRLKLERAYIAEKDHAAALHETNQKLRSLDSMKNDFLSFISHELRTPLNFISALGLLDEATDAEERTRMLEIARSGYDRLERFVARGLEYFDWIGSSRVDAAGTTEMTALVESVVADVLEKHGASSTFEVVLPESSCHVGILETDARNLLGILLDNAVKFSEGSASVRVEVASSATDVAISVADQGRGFEPDLAAILFQPFTLAHVKHHREGSALSLAIAAAMVQAHGGHIEARSAGPGRGALFLVNLPRVLAWDSRATAPSTWEPPDSAAAA